MLCTVVPAWSMDKGGSTCWEAAGGRDKCREGRLPAAG